MCLKETNEQISNFLHITAILLLTIQSPNMNTSTSGHAYVIPVSNGH